MTLGVNLIGDLGIQRGLGEAARLTADAMRQAGIEISYVHLRYDDFPLDQCDPIDPTLPLGSRYPVNLLFHSLCDFPALSEDKLQTITQGKYTIAYWVWEFPDLPDALQAQLERVDEIWTASTFCQRIFARYTKRPISVIPHPIRVAGTPDRERFGIPTERYTFLFIFDAAGSIARKNPMGIVAAFEHAFEKSDSAYPLLVIKARHWEDTAPSLASALREGIDRIGGLLLTEEHSRIETNNLMASADAYISLHRAEGFGLTIAEAMALGKPTLATAYSGNLDFMAPYSNLYVNCQRRPVIPADHADQPRFQDMYANQHWVEPDTRTAAIFMRSLASDSALGTAIGQRAMTHIRDLCSPEVVGEQIKNRLNCL